MHEELHHGGVASLPWTPSSNPGGRLVVHDDARRTQRRPIAAARATPPAPTKRRSGAGSRAATRLPALSPGAVLDLQRSAGNDAVTYLVSRQPGPALDAPPTVDPVTAQTEAAEAALRPALENVLVTASRQDNFDLKTALPAAVARALPNADGPAQARASAAAVRVTELEGEVDVPPAGPMTYDLGLVLVELDTLHRQATGLDGVIVSAGARHVVRMTARHAAEWIAAVLPGTPSAAWMHELAVQQDISTAAAAVNDATALLRLELEGTINELVDLRQVFAEAKDQDARAKAGTAIGETSRRALLLDDALARAAGRAGAAGPRAIDTAVDARAADIARIRSNAATEDATRHALGNKLSFLGATPVTIAHGETVDNPALQMGGETEATVLPEQALPETTDAAERKMAGDLADRVQQQRAEVMRLHGEVVPAHPQFSLEEFAAVHRRWFGLYSLAQEQQDATVQLILELMGDTYSMMGADYGSATVSVEGGIARSMLMNLGVDLMSGSLHGETNQFGAQVDAGGPQRRTSMAGTADAPKYGYGEMLPTKQVIEPGRSGEVQSRAGFRSARSQDTAGAATLVSALPPKLQPEQARRSGLVTGKGDVPLVGVRPVNQSEGWTYLTDVYAGPTRGLVAREQKTAAPEVAEYLIAARQQRAALAATHVPTADGRPIGSTPTRSGGVEVAGGTSAATYVKGEESPRHPSEVSSLSGQLGAARRETGVRPGKAAPSAERLTSELQAELRAYLDAFFAERQSIEWRLAAILSLANAEHQIGAQIANLLRPDTLATMIAEAVKISAIMMTLQALGPLGALAARAYQSYLSSQGVSNVAALISIAAFCRNAADADSLNRARAWGYMSRNIVADAGELFESLVTSPVTHAMGALTSKRPDSPRALAEAMAPLMADPAARKALLTDVDQHIAELEAKNPNSSNPDLTSMRAFRDSLLGRSSVDTTPAAVADLPGRTDKAVDPAAMFTGHRKRSTTDVAALKAALGPDLAGVPVVETAVDGNGVHVRYGDGGGLRVEIGRDAQPEHVRRHAETVKQLRKYEGVLGSVRSMLSRIWQALTGDPAYGTRGFEARAEVKKLRSIISELEGSLAKVDARADRMIDGKNIDPTKEAEGIAREIAAITKQLERHEKSVNSYEKGRGIISAENTKIDDPTVTKPTTPLNPHPTGDAMKDAGTMVVELREQIRIGEARTKKSVSPAIRGDLARIDAELQRLWSPYGEGGMTRLKAVEDALRLQRELQAVSDRMNAPPVPRKGVDPFDSRAWADHMRALPAGERMGLIQQVVDTELAPKYGWVYDPTVSALNATPDKKRRIYRDAARGRYYSVDFTHGTLEVLTLDGAHLGEGDYNLIEDGKPLKNHSIRVP